MMPSEPNLEEALKRLIFRRCNIRSAKPEDLASDAPLFGPESPLGLDSLDAVEVVVAVQKEYNVRILSDDVGRKALRSLRTLADHVRRERQK
jgi:acyl carrier protein